MVETSIIIRTYNEEKNLDNLLEAISKQNYKNYEIIVVDSGSIDKTVEIAERFKVKLLKIENRDFTFGHALNVGCQEALGKYLVFVSAHILPVDNDWLGNLIKPFQNKKIAIVYGRQLGDKCPKFSERRDFHKFFGDRSFESKVLISYANNANSAIRKDLWQKEKFDEYLFGLEDLGWSQKILEKGFLIYYQADASIFHIHQEEWHKVYNRYRREAIAAAKIGLNGPPQSKIGVSWFFLNLFIDFLTSFPNWSFDRLEEILRFRYYQTKASRQGWFKDRGLDVNRDKFNVFYSVKNKSVVIKSLNKASLEEVPLPELKPGDVLLKVEYVGICRTDLEVLNGKLGYYRDGLADYPIVPGHEYCGTIVSIGANNKFRERFKVGQRVVGECILSRDEKDRKEVGVINYNGAYSQYIVIPGNAIHPVPEELDSKTASMTEPLAVVLRAIRRIQNRLKENSSIAVLGAGSIGNLCSQVLNLEGYRVSIFDKNKDRLDLLKNKIEKVGTDFERLKGFDVIIEATGSKEVLEQAIKKSRNDATILLLGFPYGRIDYNFEDLVGCEKVFAGSVGGDSQDFVKALSLLPRLDMTPFTKKTLALEKFEEAWKIHQTSKYLKIILKP